MTMNQDLFNRVVKFLTPHMEEDSRYTLLTQIFKNDLSIYNKIDWKGSSQAFTVRLVRLLEPHQTKLERLLKILYSDVGLEDQNEINELLELSASSKSQKTKASSTTQTISTSQLPKQKWYEVVLGMPSFAIASILTVLLLIAAYLIFKAPISGQMSSQAEVQGTTATVFNPSTSTPTVTYTPTLLMPTITTSSLPTPTYISPAAQTYTPIPAVPTPTDALILVLSTPTDSPTFVPPTWTFTPIPPTETFTPAPPPIPTWTLTPIPSSPTPFGVELQAPFSKASEGVQWQNMIST